MTTIIKKLCIAIIASAMVITSTSFAVFATHDKHARKAISKTEENIPPKKAYLTTKGEVTGRNEDGTSDDTSIDVQTITDLLVDANLAVIPANKFANLKKLLHLSFQGADSSSALTTIGKGAFKGSGIRHVILPKHLSVIEEEAFANTTDLSTLDFRNAQNLTHIRKKAFLNSGLHTLDLSPMDTATTSSLTIETDAFKGNKNLTSLTLSTKMQTLTSTAFSSTMITSIHIPKSIVTLSPIAFQDSPLITITVDKENSMYTVEDNVLYNKNKTYLFLYPEARANPEFRMPDSVTYIWPLAIHAPQQLQRVVIGKALTEITQASFINAKKLTTLDLRNATALEIIGTHACKDSALTTMIIGSKTGSLDTIGENAFQSSAPTKQVLFLNDDNTPITKVELARLIQTYEFLKTAQKGAWNFSTKLPKPTATIDYDNMQVIALDPSTSYRIQKETYMSDANGTIPLLKDWGGNTITIVKNPDEADESHIQELPIAGLFTLTLDDVTSLKKVGTTITVSAPDKSGYVFTTWLSTNVDIPTPNQKNITFTMPSNDVTLAKEYRALRVSTPTTLKFDGKNDVVVTIESDFSNFSKLSLHANTLSNDDYTVTGTTTTILTLKQKYLHTLASSPTFIASFKEGGEVSFHIRLSSAAPTAIANYHTMKLTNLEKHTTYYIHGHIQTTDANGFLTIEKAWSTTTLEIIKKATEIDLDSKPQYIKMETFYTIHMDDKEIHFYPADVDVTVHAPKINDYLFKEWKTTGITLSSASNEQLTFKMPKNNVTLMPIYVIAKSELPIPPKIEPTPPTLPVPVLPQLTPPKPLIKSPSTADRTSTYIYYLFILVSFALYFFTKQKNTKN